MNPRLTKSRRAAADIAAGFLILKYATPAVDGTVAVATGPTDALAGVADSLAVTQGQMQDVHVLGFTEVRLGGTVAAGDRLTSDANGKAVKVAAATDHSIGFAQAPGVADDIIPITAVPG